MLIIGALLIFSLACSMGGSTATPAANGSGNGDETTTEATVEATEEGSDSNSDVPEIDSNALEGLNSYRAHMAIRQEYADGTTVSMIIDQDEIREPRAQRMVMETSGQSEGQDGKIEMILADGKQWMNMGGSWMQTEATEDSSNAFGQGFSSFTSLTTELEDGNYKMVGEETINGVKTKHYHTDDYENLGSMSTLGITDLKSATGDVWVSNQSDLPVMVIKFTMTLEGTITENEVAKEGKYIIEMEISDLNADFTIEVPEEAASGGLPDGIPAYEGATGMFSSAGLVSFNTTDDVATVGKFYEEQMTANGWAKDSDNSAGDMVMQNWSKDNVKVTLMVTKSDDGGSSVMFTIEQ